MGIHGFQMLSEFCEINDGAAVILLISIESSSFHKHLSKHLFEHNYPVPSFLKMGEVLLFLLIFVQILIFCIELLQFFKN